MEGPPTLHPSFCSPLVAVASASLLNVLEFPALALPLGRSQGRNQGRNQGPFAAKGLPVGCQLVAAPGKEHLLVAVAEALEEEGVAFAPHPNY